MKIVGLYTNTFSAFDRKPRIGLKRRKHQSWMTALLMASTTLAQPPAGHVTSVAPYAVSISSHYAVVPILSVGEPVPHASDAGKQYQLVGFPDGLGAHRADEDRTVVYMNHEMPSASLLTEPVLGEPLHRGAFVSKFILNKEGQVLAGERGYDVIVDLELGIERAPARVDNNTPAFVRFCSGSLAWHEAGFDRPIYFCGEEGAAPGTFDGKGGLGCAVFDQRLYTLPHLGRFPRENTLVRPHPTPETVLLMMEDGPASPDSQLYLYVGRKDPTPGAHPLARNGLIGGKFYVFVSTTPGANNEITFQTGTISGTWVEITSVADKTEAQLEAACDAVGAYGFVRTEDGAWSLRDKNEFFFVSTGDAVNAPAVAGNHFGRMYQLLLNREDVTGPCTLTIIYNADHIIMAGGDIAIAPDNIAVGKDSIMVCEDGFGHSRNVMANKKRDGLIWRFDLERNFEATPVVSLDTPARDGTVIGAGVWETTGILDAEHFYGRDSWLFNVQAHAPTLAPVPNTVEDGQLLLLLPVEQNENEIENESDN